MSTSVEWSKPWSKSTLCKGNGVIVEGEVVGHRIHSVFLRGAVDKTSQEDQLPTRFLAIVVKVDIACKRNFDANGIPLPPPPAHLTSLSSPLSISSTPSYSHQLKLLLGIEIPPKTTKAKAVNKGSYLNQYGKFSKYTTVIRSNVSFFLYFTLFQNSKKNEKEKN